MKMPFRASLWALCFAIAAVGLGWSAVGLGSSAVTQVPSTDIGDWVLPRTPDGHPDLQGNWTNVTLTPFSRPVGQGAILTSGRGRRDRAGARGGRSGDLAGE